MPTWSLPGVTSLPSSMNTLVVGLCVNLAVEGGTPFIEMLLPIEPSDEPMASTRMTCSMRSSSCSFTSAVHITPEETIIFNCDRSYGVPAAAAASMARMIGLAKASPTMVMLVTDSFCTVRSTSSGSSERLWRVTTAAPPSCGIIAPSHTPVPCISGAHGIEMSPPPASMMPFTSGAMSVASVGAARPSIGRPSWANDWVRLPMSYITPLGMPVVPPVYIM